MKDLIYNQRKIPKDQWRYGFRTSAATGCEHSFKAICRAGVRGSTAYVLLWLQRKRPNKAHY